MKALSQPLLPSMRELARRAARRARRHPAGTLRRGRLCLVPALLLALGACEQGPGAGDAVAPASESAAPESLAGTRWQLLEIQSMDDSRWSTSDPERYTLEFNADGEAYMRFDCNRGNAGWESSGANQLTFERIASTKALCNDEGLSERYAAQLEYVRSYVLRDGHLFLATLADGAILNFRPAAP